MARAEAVVEGRDEEEKGQNNDSAALSISTTSITAYPQNTTRKGGLQQWLSSVCLITPKSLVAMICISALISALLLSILPLVLHLQVVGATVTVTGASGGIFPNGSRPFRQEIYTFQESGPPMDLFVLAFRAFQQMDQSNVQSYYQISGIHGYPNKAWDGVNGANKLGYCAHNSVVFPVWHRPYLALFEQILWEHAQTIAKTYPLSLRSQYVAAATTLRLPYWDWAINPTMPTTFTTPTIDVTSPDGKVIIPNPLYNYTFHPLPLGTDFPTNQGLSFYRSTVRYPDKLGQSQQAISNQVLASESAAILSLTYQILSSEKNYSMMSNSVLGTYNSVENIHNGIHTWVGGTGHMALIPWSAFDPIFWIHHAQVDRVFALWQALNPDSYVEPNANEMGTFTEQPGFVETADTPLTPFHFSSSLFYTATTARSTRSFGYSYPELPDWSVNATQLQSTVRTKVNALYNPTTNSVVKRGTRGTRKTKAQKNTGLHLVDSASNETVDNDMMRAGPMTVEKCVQMGINNLPMQWAVSFQVDKFILSSPFSIHVFLTAPPADPAQWATCPQHVGSGTIFTMANTTVQPSVIVSGQIPLTHALAQAVDDGILASLDSGHVGPLLKNSLEWRIQKVDGNPVDTEDLIDGKGEGRLKIGVISREVTPRVQDDAFPIYASWNTWPSITAGKVGGTKAAKPA